MAGKLKIFAYVTVLLAVMLVSVGCGDDLAELDISADTYSFTPELDLFEQSFDDDKVTEAHDASEQTEALELPETFAGISSVTEGVYDDMAGGVYWVADGEVWHLTRGCWTLARSKKIISGTVTEAIAAGKTRVCKVCSE